MRASEVERIWSEFGTAPALTPVSTITISGLGGITNGDIHFKGNVCVLVGYNGSGKTALLNCVRGVLSNTEQEQDAILSANRLKAAELAVTLSVNGEPLTAKKAVGTRSSKQNDFQVEVQYIDTAVHAPLLQAFSRKTTNLNEQLQQHETHALKREELELMGFVVGKEYSAATATDLGDDYEVEGTPEDDSLGNLSTIPDELLATGSLPIFSVTSANLSYSTADMGLGELAAFYIYWRLRSAPAGSIVLIEEPESFLAPRSQAHLMTLIVSFAVKKRFWILVSTHSEHILERLPAHAITVLARNQHGHHSPRPASTTDEVLNQLRLDGRRVGTIFVEDWGGFHFLRELTASEGNGIERRYKCIPVFGDGNIQRLITTYPRIPSSNPLIGVRDADKHGVIPHAKWPTVSLPGSKAPEIELIETLKNAPELLAARLGCNKAVVVDALGLLGGTNHHDFIGELGRKLGLSYQTMFHHLVAVWKATGTNGDHARAFLEQFDAAIQAAEAPIN